MLSESESLQQKSEFKAKIAENQRGKLENFDLRLF